MLTSEQRSHVELHSSDDKHSLCANGEAATSYTEAVAQYTKSIRPFLQTVGIISKIWRYTGSGVVRCIPHGNLFPLVFDASFAIKGGICI